MLTLARGTLMASGRRGLKPDQMQFAAVQQFPLHLLSGLQSDGGHQRQRHVDMEARGLVLGANNLYFYGIFCWHPLRVLCRALPCQTIKCLFARSANRSCSPTWGRAESWPTFPAAPFPPMAARCCCAKSMPTLA